MKKKGFTLEQHKEIGKELFAMRERLTRLTVEISHAYPFTGKLSKPYGFSAKAVSTIDRLRCNLEDNLFSESPDLGNKGLEIYYPGHVD